VLIKIWNFLRGYVKIEMSGFSVERLITQAAAVDVFFWDARRTGGAVAAQVSVRDYKHLAHIAEKTGTTLTAIGPFGLPAVIKRFKKRVALIFGGLFFIGALVVLTSFVWRIDIHGTNRISAEEMTEFLAENGFATGVFRHGIAYRDVESLLMTRFSDIAWVSLSIRGTWAQIHLVETIEQPGIVDTATPTDIVAAKDGIITHMATSRGTPMFRPGDVVREGDVLVSGRLEIAAEYQEPTYAYVRADSQIWARVYYRMDFEVPLVFFEKSFTGRSQRVYSIDIAGREFTLPHGDHDFIYYDTTQNRRQMAFGADYPLPVAWATTEYFELVRYLRSRTAAEAKQIGEEMVQSLLDAELPYDTRIDTKEINFTEEEKVLVVEVFLITMERIDLERQMMVDNAVAVIENTGEN